MTNREAEQRLRDEAKSLLESAKVDYIVGFADGSLKFHTTPLITRNKDDVDHLVINPFMASNLAKFLTELEGRVGIVAKGCDSRSIVSLVQDNKVSREKVVIVGIPCRGMINLSKIEQLAGKESDEIDDITRQGDKVVVKLDGSEKEIPVKEVLFDHCLACELPTPKEYDLLIDEPIPATPDEEASQAKINKLEELSHHERWRFWQNEFSRCIRCYACRNVCPACYCQRCFVEEAEPQWILSIPKWQDNLIFQIIRNIHLAGRCTDCGECERACPVNIPLRSLSKEMYDLVGELFGFKSGMEIDAAPLLTHYELEEAEDFFR